MCEKRDENGVKERACGVDRGLEVLCQSLVATNLSEEPLDEPIPSVGDRVDMVRIVAHDLDRDQCRFSNFLTQISAIGEDPLDEREDTSRDLQKQSTAVATPDARWMRLEYETEFVFADECMALAPTDLIANFVAA